MNHTNSVFSTVHALGSLTRIFMHIVLFELMRSFHLRNIGGRRSLAYYTSQLFILVSLEAKFRNATDSYRSFDWVHVILPSLIKLWFWRKETFQLKPNSLNFFLDFHTNYAQKECTSVWLQSVGGIGESNSSIFCHISSFCIMLMHEIRWELMIYFNLNASAYIPPHILIPKCNFFLNNKLPT